MQGVNTESYYADRAAQERLMAEKAVDPKVREIHEEMASRYDVLAQGAAPSEREAAG
jgi:hypothetical protein